MEPATVLNIAAAALLMQFLLLLVLSVAAYWIRTKEAESFRFWDNPPSLGRHAWVVLAFALVTIGPLMFSDAFATSWRPLFSDLAIPLVNWSGAILWVFVLDLLFCTYLIASTGGGYVSPFTPVCFVLPALALFLHESPKMVVLYTLGIAISFSITLAIAERSERSRRSYLGAYWFVSLSCLLLSVLIGYVTRQR
jgi:hypothetical protein